MPRSGTRSVARRLDLRALRARRDAVPVSNAYSSEHPDPGVLIEAQTAATKIAAGDHTHAYRILVMSRSALGQGRPALAIVEQAVLDAFARDKKGELIEGYARRFLTPLKVERRYSPDMARASYEPGSVVHLRSAVDEKGRFRSFCGRTFFPIGVRRGTAAAAQLPAGERPLGMEGATLCRRCATHADKLPGLLEPAQFPVLSAPERRQVELAALAGFCAHPDGVPDWRVKQALAHALQQIAIDRLSRFAASDFDRVWLRSVLGLRNGFFRAYGENVSDWPFPSRDLLERAVTRLPPALVLEQQDETFEAFFRSANDQMLDDVLPPLLASCWAAARDLCNVKAENEIADGVVGDTDRRLRSLLAVSGREL